MHDRAGEMRGAGARVQEERGQDDRPVLWWRPQSWGVVKGKANTKISILTYFESTVYACIDPSPVLQNEMKRNEMCSAIYKFIMV